MKVSMIMKCSHQSLLKQKYHLISLFLTVTSCQCGFVLYLFCCRSCFFSTKCAKRSHFGITSSEDFSSMVLSELSLRCTSKWSSQPLWTLNSSNSAISPRLLVLSQLLCSVPSLFCYHSFWWVWYTRIVKMSEKESGRLSMACSLMSSHKRVCSSSITIQLTYSRGWYILQR